MAIILWGFLQALSYTDEVPGPGHTFGWHSVTFFTKLTCVHVPIFFIMSHARTQQFPAPSLCPETEILSATREKPINFFPFGIHPLSVVSVLWNPEVRTLCWSLVMKAQVTIEHLAFLHQYQVLQCLVLKGYTPGPVEPCESFYLWQNGKETNFEKI